MPLTEEFKAYVAEVVARHFEHAPEPDGTTETNREHIRLRDAALAELRKYIRKMDLTLEERDEAFRHAENEAQRGVYALFDKPVRRNKRYKGMKGI